MGTANQQPVNSLVQGGGEPAVRKRRAKGTQAALTRQRTRRLSGDLDSRFDLRAVPAGKALRGCGAIFHNPSPAAYSLSKSVPSIDCFWSHSWKGPKWAKIWTLLVYHNGLPGWCLSLVSALAAGLLLPPRVAHRVELAFLLGIVVGMLTFVATLLVWPCQDQVFLDVACIDQKDNEQKQAGILSIGSILKRSQKMVVVWDRTVYTRLWCIFELATWLKRREGGDHHASLIMLPSFYGFFVGGMSAALSLMHCALNTACLTVNVVHPTLMIVSPPTPVELVHQFLGMFVASFFMLLTIVARPILREFQEFSLQTEQLQAFSIKNAECTCCSLNHRDPASGERMPCDREIITRVVGGWFGSVEDFDSHVRDQVFKSIRAQVPPFVLITTPVLWESLAGFAWLVRQGDPWQGFLLLPKAVSISLFLAPACISLVMASFRRFAGKAHRGSSAVCTMVKASALAATGPVLLSLLDAMVEVILGPWWSFFARGLMSVCVWCLTNRFQTL